MAFYGRGKNKVRNPYTFKHMYDFYLDEIGENPLYQIEYSEYVDLCGDFYKAIVNEILENAIVFKMPFGLGKLNVVKKKVLLHRLRSVGMDWEATSKIGKQVYHLNEHSGGYKYFFHWIKLRNALINKIVYRLVMTRTNKRRLAKLIKSRKYDYFEIN